MRSLFGKLSIALLFIVAIAGCALFLVQRYSTASYYEELTQRLNAPIAMYVTQQEPLIDRGVPKVEQLKELAKRAMIVNPTVEIYLLDLEGNILAHDLPPESVQLQRVDLAPIQDLISGQARIPLRAEDPRNPGREKVFSAAEVSNDNRHEGYLYVVLGGEKYDALANDISASYVRRVGLGAIIGIIAITAAVSVLVFRLLTRRLTQLTSAVHMMAECDFQRVPDIQKSSKTGDEIDCLSEAFSAMSQKIQAQLAQLKRSDSLRRELVSNISHDLRTPLAALQGYLETLIIKNGSFSDAERDNYLRIARRHSQRLGELIEDLFELSKLDSANVPLREEAFSLPELLQDIVQDFQLETERKGIQLTIEVNEPVGETIADIGLMQRVFENLLRNAIRFTPSQGQITLSVQSTQDGLAVAIADTGCGIADNELPRIFDRFHRAENGEEAQSSSSGLGLAIVKRILELHGSRITVTSTLGVGTRFEFALPNVQRAA